MQTEERVELQIIKICLTIMVSHTIDIDQRSVLQIVKTCFNIYLTTRSKINEATAQGCLSQILQVIFSKLEQQAVKNVTAQPPPDDEQTIIREILDELVERISYGK